MLNSFGLYRFTSHYWRTTSPSYEDETGTTILRVDQEESIKCYATTLKEKKDKQECLQVTLDLSEEKNEQRGSPVEELDTIHVWHDD